MCQNPQPRVQPNLPPRSQPSLQPSLRLEPIPVAPPIEHVQHFKSRTRTRKRCLSLSRREHTSQQIISWSFCGSYTLMFAYLVFCSTSLAFLPGAWGYRYFRYVSQGVWGYRYAQAGISQGSSGPDVARRERPCLNNTRGRFCNCGTFCHCFHKGERGRRGSQQPDLQGVETEWLLHGNLVEVQVQSGGGLQSGGPHVALAWA